MTKEFTKHDHFFSKVMGELNVARDFFKAYLPDEIKNEIDHTSLIDFSVIIMCIEVTAHIIPWIFYFIHEIGITAKIMYHCKCKTIILKGVFMSLWHGNKILLLIFATLLPACVFAANDFTTYQLTNQSQKYEPKGYYLIKDKTFGEPGCVFYKSKNQVNPGDSISFDIKNDCIWGGIKFRIFHVADHKPLGYLSQTFRDGLVSLEVATSCQGKQCNFFGISPQR